MDVEDKKNNCCQSRPFLATSIFVHISPGLCQAGGGWCSSSGTWVGGYTKCNTSSSFGEGCWISSNGYRKSAIGGGLHRPGRGCTVSTMALCCKSMKRIVWQREQVLYREEGYVEGRQK